MPGPVATIGSMHLCPMSDGPKPHVGGPIIGPGAPNVMINGKSAALMGDMCTCMSAPDVIAMGAPSVFINGVPVVCQGDLTAHGGVIVQGEPNVIIGTATPLPPVVMPEDEIPFPTISIKNRVLSVLTGNSNTEAKENQDKLRENTKEEVLEVKLTSTFGLDQLQLMAKKDSLILFIYVIKRIYGNHYSNDTVKKLYEDAKNKNAQLNPTIVVVKNTSVGNGGPAGYSNKTHELLVSERFIRKASIDNDQRAELMVALVEEVGHHIHYLLHDVYTPEEERKDLPSKKSVQGDPGARFARQVIQINLLENEEQYFADAEIDGNSSQAFIWEWKELHSNLKQHVNEARQNRNDTGEINNYKAGKIDVNHGHYGHQDIEEVALKDLLSLSKYGRDFKRIEDSEKKNKIFEILHKIYLGNWMRDFSQLVDPGIIRPLANTVIDYSKKNKGNIKNVRNATTTNPSDEPVLVSIPYGVEADYKGEFFSPSTWFNFETNIIFKEKKVRPITWSREFMTTMVSILGVSEFMKPEKKEDLHKANYDVRIKDFKEQYLEITSEVLGVYRPDEHIDNPLTVPADKNAHNPKLNKPNEKYGFVGQATLQETAIGKTYGMKNYIRTHNTDADTRTFSTKRTAYDFVIEKIQNARSNLNFSNINSMVDFGAALHVIEDYFAHTNYVEIAIAKVSSNDRVFPWVDLVENHTPYPGAENFNYDTFAKLNPLEAKQYLNANKTPSVIGLTKIKFDATVVTKPNEIVRYIPLVTGTFGELDMLASVLPILEEKLFSIEITPYEESEPGERTLNDVIILEICKDLDNIQNLDGTGTNDDAFVTRFEDLLEIRDGIKSVTNTIPKFMRTYAHDIMERIGAMINFGFYNLLKMAGKRIADAQLLLKEQVFLIEKKLDGKGKGIVIGTNPTHTQIAKDDPDKPLHELSALLAVHAVKQIGEKMFKMWANKGVSLQRVLNEVDTIMQHPAVSTWQDKMVLDWATKNQRKVCLASTPSVIVDSIIHSLEEINSFNNKLIDMSDGKLNGAGVGFTTMDSILQSYDEDGSLRENFKDLLNEGDTILQKAERLKNRYGKEYYKPTMCN